ncbi:hypothetical protein HBB16_07375 [Pseudonocardia sp. MCCB 268]|nr:hypothetical protein [Pseudonocardia cytotoxica]
MLNRVFFPRPASGPWSDPGRVRRRVRSAPEWADGCSVTWATGSDGRVLAYTVLMMTVATVARARRATARSGSRPRCSWSCCACCRGFSAGGEYTGR